MAKKKNLNRAGNMDIDLWRQRQIRQIMEEHFRSEGRPVPPRSSREYAAAYQPACLQFAEERRLKKQEKLEKKRERIKMQAAANRQKKSYAAARTRGER